MQKSNSQVVAPQLERPLRSVLTELSFAKRLRLKWLLKRTNPELALANERNVDAFVTSFLQLIEPRIYDGPRTDAKILAIKRAAVHQIIRTNVLSLANSRQAKDASTYFKTKQMLANLRNHPLAMMGILWQIPHIRSQNLPNNLVDVVLRGRLTDTLTTAQEALANKQITIEDFRRVRSAANFILLGVGFAFTYNFASDFYVQFDEKMTKEAEQYARQREEKKTLDLKQASTELQQVQSQQTQLQTNPVGFFEELMIEDHIQQTGRQPSASDRAEIHQIAVEQAAESAQRTNSQAK